MDTTPEILAWARAGAVGAADVEFREGHVEALPLPDGLINNGVLNLTVG